MNIYDLMKQTVQMKASDLHITVGIPPTVRVNGQLKKISDEILKSSDTEAFVKEITTPKQFADLEERGEMDFSVSIPGFHRFRLNAYKQRGSYGIAIRVVFSKIPSFESLGLPPIVKELTKKTRGLILVTGPTGSGKSTTLACMVDEINRTRDGHIITLEEPIEYFHAHNMCIVNQREIGHDSQSFASALRAALRQDPDVILIGEMRDLETTATAITAAETGHLVLSTLHTIGASKTIDRIIDQFPPHQQQQVKIQLSMVLQGVISQQLLPVKDHSRRVVAVETMVTTPAIKNMIREGKTHQIDNAIQTGRSMGMISMDNSLLELYRRNLISMDDLLTYSVDTEYVRKLIGA
jgi:twitching motility protein PilT